MKYDLILGMHWLSTYHAHVDYDQKRISFNLEGTTKFIFEEIKNKLHIPLILAIKADKLLKHGYQGYVATIVDKKDDEVKKLKK